MDPAPDNIAYLYDGSVEGLFTAVFLTYANKEHPLDICPSEHYQPRIGQTTRQIETDFSLALRVQKGVSKRAGYSVANILSLIHISEPHWNLDLSLHPLLHGSAKRSFLPTEQKRRAQCSTEIHGCWMRTCFVERLSSACCSRSRGRAGFEA